MGYKLFYFDVKGRGEPIRLLLHAAGQEFEDVRLSQEEWPEIKGTMPTKMLPVLEFDGKKLPETLAIMRYLATKHNMNGKNEIEAAGADAASAVIYDLWSFVRSFYKEEDEEIKKKKEETFKTETTPNVFESLVSLKHIYGTENHLAGDSLTYADILYSYTLESFKEMGHYEPDEPSELLGIHKAVASNPGIAKYLKHCCH